MSGRHLSRFEKSKYMTVELLHQHVRKRHFNPAVQSMGNAGPPPFTTISMPPLCSMVLQYFVISGYCNTLCLLEPCKVLGFRGCNLWVLPLAWRARPAAKLGPCIVDDPTGHTCKLQSASIPHPGSRLRSRLREVLVPRSRRAFSTQQQV